MNLKFVVASVLLLLLCSEVLSHHLQKRDAEDQSVFTKIQETAKGYMDYLSDVTNTWVDKVKSFDISQRFWNGYENFTSTVGTYRNIISDQMYHYLWPNE